jgi:hypothetical protein
LFNAIAAMSLVFCAAILSLAALNLFRDVNVSRVKPANLFGCSLTGEKLVVHIMGGQPIESILVGHSYKPGWRASLLTHTASGRPITFLGALKPSYRYWIQSVQGKRYTHHDIELPLWIPFAIAAVSPLMWCYRQRRGRRRLRHNFCDSCGYDLRATPERCPECGMIPAID